MKRLRGRAAAALAVALWCCGLHAQSSPGATVRRDGDAIHFSGRIEQHSVAEFLRLAAEPGVGRVVVRSQGGIVDPALDMANAIVDRGLDVEVDGACLSSCANYVFPAGRHKLLSGPAAVGWHGNMAHVLYRAAHGEEQWAAPELAQARALARREAAFFARIGVDGFVCWFGKIPPYDAPEFYALSVGDMAGFGIRDVAVRDPAEAPSADVQLLSVEWSLLESMRPPEAARE